MLLFIVTTLVWVVLPVHFLHYLKVEKARSTETELKGPNWWYRSYSAHFFISLWMLLYVSPFSDSLWGFPFIGIVYMASMIGQRIMVSRYIDEWNVGGE